MPRARRGRRRGPGRRDAVASTRGAARRHARHVVLALPRRRIRQIPRRGRRVGPRGRVRGPGEDGVLARGDHAVAARRGERGAAAAYCALGRLFLGAPGLVPDPRPRPASSRGRKRRGASLPGGALRARPACFEGPATPSREGGMLLLWYLCHTITKPHPLSHAANAPIWSFAARSFGARGPGSRPRSADRARGRTRRHAARALASQHFRQNATCQSAASSSNGAASWGRCVADAGVDVVDASRDGVHVEEPLVDVPVCSGPQYNRRVGLKVSVRLQSRASATGPPSGVPGSASARTGRRGPAGGPDASRRRRSPGLEIARPRRIASRRPRATSRSRHGRLYGWGPAPPRVDLPPQLVEVLRRARRRPGAFIVRPVAVEAHDQL